MTQVSELLTLKIENIRLKLNSLQQVANALNSEAATLLEQARAEVGAPPNVPFNTETRTFEAPAQPLSTSKVRQMKRAKAS